MLRLRLFGRPVIEQNDSLVTQLNNRKAEALLFYLALTPGQQRRHHLANLLWSDMPEDKALRNLRYTLWKLRQVLDDVPLNANRLTVSLSSDGMVWVDVLEFQKLATMAGGTPNAEQIASFEQAYTLYLGDFLTGFELSAAPFFEDWVQQQRATLRDMYVAILTPMADFYAHHHQLDRALTVTRRLLEVEPWQEAAHRQLMLLLALDGQRGVALEHYQYLKQMLAADLDLEPEPETVTLWEQIHTGQIVPTPTPPVGINESQDDASQLESSEEYSWLLKQWEAARQGIDPAAEGRCLQALGDFAKEEADYRQALEHYEAALINFSQTIETRLAAACLISIADTYLITNQFQPALDCLDEAMAYADAGQHTGSFICALLALIRTHLFLGDLGTAQAKSEEVMALCNDEANLQLDLSMGLGLQGYLYLLQGDFELAQAQLERARSIVQEITSPQVMSEFQQYWGHLYLVKKDFDRALTCFKEAEKSGQSDEIIEALSYQARAHLALEQLEQALGCSNQAIEKLAIRKNGVAAAQRIYLNHYYVLLANGQDAGARSALEIAHQLVSTQLAAISVVDVTTQENFLRNLPWNREIVSSWKVNTPRGGFLTPPFIQKVDF